MKTRIFPYSITVFLLIALIVVAYPHSSVLAQDCVDEKGNKIECPPKEPPIDPPKDPGNPPAQEDQNNNPNSPNTVILDTPTPTATDTPKPTETKVPTATATKPVMCDCSNAVASVGGQPGSSNPPPVPVPDPAPLFPWLMAGGGVLIGLVLGALTGPAVMGGSLFPPAPRPDPPPMGGGSSFGDDESTRFVKLERPADPATTGAEKQDFGDDGSALFVKVDRTTDHKSAPFRLQSAAQVTEVHVLGYDDTHKKEIVGSATTGDVSGSLGISPHLKGGPHIKQDGSTGEFMKQDDPSILDSSSQPDLNPGEDHSSRLDNSSQPDLGADSPGSEHMKKWDDHD